MRKIDWKNIKDKYAKSFKAYKIWYTDNESRGKIDLFPTRNKKLWIWYWLEGGIPDYVEGSPVMNTQDLYDFFDSFNIYVSVKKEAIGSDEWEFSYEIQYLPKEFENTKRRCQHFVIIESFSIYGALYVGAYPERIQAEVEAFSKSFDVLEKSLSEHTKA